MKLMIALSNTLNPDNAAAVLRLMASFRFEKLYLINPKFNIKDVNYAIARSGFPLLDSAETVDDVRSLKGKCDVIIATSAKETSGNNIVRSFITVDDMQKKAIEMPADSKVLLLLGSEDKGLSNDELEFSDFVVTILTSDMQRALNLSHSAAILMERMRDAALNAHERGNTADESVQQKSSLASKGEKELIVKKASGIYDFFNSYNDNDPAKRLDTQEIVWRRLVGKALLTRTEARTLLGFLSELDNAKEKMKGKR